MRLIRTITPVGITPQPDLSPGCYEVQLALELRVGRQIEKASTSFFVVPTRFGNRSCRFELIASDKADPNATPIYAWLVEHAELLKLSGEVERCMVAMAEAACEHAHWMVIERKTWEIDQ